MSKADEDRAMDWLFGTKTPDQRREELEGDK